MVTIDLRTSKKEQRTNNTKKSFREFSSLKLSKLSLLACSISILIYLFWALSIPYLAEQSSWQGNLNSKMFNVRKPYEKELFKNIINNAYRKHPLIWLFTQSRIPPKYLAIRPNAIDSLHYIAYHANNWSPELAKSNYFKSVKEGTFSEAIINKGNFITKLSNEIEILIEIFNKHSDIKTNIKAEKESLEKRTKYLINNQIELRKFLGLSALFKIKSLEFKTYSKGPLKGTIILDEIPDNIDSHQLLAKHLASLNNKSISSFKNNSLKRKFMIRTSSIRSLISEIKSQIQTLRELEDKISKSSINYENKVRSVITLSQTLTNFYLSDMI